MKIGKELAMLMQVTRWNRLVQVAGMALFSDCLARSYTKLLIIVS